jgi:hypothetical protein
MRLAMQYFPVLENYWSRTIVTLVTKAKLLFYLVTRFLPNGFAVGCEKTLR